MDYDQTQRLDLDFSQDEAEDEPEEICQLKKVVAILSVENQDAPAKEYPLYIGVNIIGRAPDSQVYIDKKALSKKHAVIQMESDTSALLFDLGSINKTRKGKVPLKPNVRYNLENNDGLWFGNVRAVFKFKVKEEEDDDTSEAESESMISFEFTTGKPTTPAESAPMVKAEVAEPKTKPTANFNLLGESDDATGSESELSQNRKIVKKPLRSDKSMSSSFDSKESNQNSSKTDINPASQGTESLDLLADLNLSAVVQKSPVKVSNEAATNSATTSTNNNTAGLSENEKDLFENDDVGSSNAGKKFDVLNCPTQAYNKEDDSGDETGSSDIDEPTKLSENKTKQPNADVLNAMTQPVQTYDDSGDETGSSDIDEPTKLSENKTIQPNADVLNAMTQPVQTHASDEDDETNSESDLFQETNECNLESSKLLHLKSKPKACLIDLNAMTQPLMVPQDDADVYVEDVDPKIFDLETQPIEIDNSEGKTRPLEQDKPKTPLSGNVDLNAVTQPVLHLSDFDDSDSFTASPNYKKIVSAGSLTSKSGSSLDGKTFREIDTQIATEKYKTSSFVAADTSIGKKTKKLFNPDESEILCFESQQTSNRTRKSFPNSNLSVSCVEDSYVETSNSSKSFPKVVLSDSFKVPNAPDKQNCRKSIPGIKPLDDLESNEKSTKKPESMVDIVNSTKSFGITIGRFVDNKDNMDKKTETKSVAKTKKNASKSKNKEDKESGSSTEVEDEKENSSILELPITTEEKKKGVGMKTFGITICKSALNGKNKESSNEATLQNVTCASAKEKSESKVDKEKSSENTGNEFESDELPDISDAFSISKGVRSFKAKRAKSAPKKSVKYLPSASSSCTESENSDKSPLIKSKKQKLKKSKDSDVSFAYTQDAHEDFSDMAKSVSKNKSAMEIPASYENSSKRNSREKKVPKRFLDDNKDEPKTKKKANNVSLDLMKKIEERALGIKSTTKRKGKKSKEVVNDESKTGDKEKQIPNGRLLSDESEPNRKKSNSKLKKLKNESIELNINAKEKVISIEDELRIITESTKNLKDELEDDKGKTSTKKSRKKKGKNVELIQNFNVLQAVASSSSYSSNKSNSIHELQIEKPEENDLEKLGNKRKKKLGKKSSATLDGNSNNKIDIPTSKTTALIQGEKEAVSDISDKSSSSLIIGNLASTLEEKKVIEGKKKSAPKRSRKKIIKDTESEVFDNRPNEAMVKKSGKQKMEEPSTSSVSMIIESVAKDIREESSTSNTNKRTRGKPKSSKAEDPDCQVTSSQDLTLIKNEPINEELDFQSPPKRKKREPKVPSEIKINSASKKNNNNRVSTSPALSSCSMQSKRGTVNRKRSASPDYSVILDDSPAKKLNLQEKGFKIMFTGFTDNKYEKIIESLGGTVTTSIEECTHLITDQFRRTTKMLCAVGKGVYVLNGKWIESAKKKKSLANFKKFTLRDKDAEVKYSFTMEDTQKKASNCPLLSGWSIHVTPAVLPTPDQMKDIIESAGGIFLPKMPRRKSAKLVVVSCHTDLKLCNAARKNGIPIVNAEFLLTGLLAYKIDIESHKL